MKSVRFILDFGFWIGAGSHSFLVHPIYRVQMIALLISENAQLERLRLCCVLIPQVLVLLFHEFRKCLIALSAPAAIACRLVFRIPQVLIMVALDNSASADAPHRQSERHVWMTTHTYSSHRIKYARFCWGKGAETWGYVHIAGGDCSSEVVQTRRSEIDHLIATGAPLLEILDLLRSFENERPGRKPQKR